MIRLSCKKSRRSASGLFGLLALTWGLSVSAPAAEDPVQDQSEAYVMLIQADQSRDAEDHAKAVYSYRKALERYNRLAARFPDWETDVVQYRLAYCANQLAAIVRKTGKSEEDWLAVQALIEPSAEDRLQRQHAATTEENRYLRTRLHELESAEDASEWKEEAARLRTENGRLARDLAALTKPDINTIQRELAVLQKENETLQQRVEKSAKKIAAMEVDAEKGQSEVRAQDKRAEVLASKNRDLEGQLDSIEKKLAEIGPLREQLERQRKAHAAIAEQAERRSAEAESLQQKLAAQSNRLEALTGAKHLLQDALTEKEKAVEALEGQRAQWEVARKELEEKVARLSGQEELQRQLLDQRQREATAWSNRWTEAEAQFAGMASLSNELERAKAQIDELRQQALRRETLEPTPISKPEPVRVPVQLTARALTREEVDDMMKRGLVYEQKGEFPEALKIYDQILVERPAYGEALKARGRGLLQIGDGAGALEALQECVRWAPLDSQGQLLLGVACCRVQKFREAVEVLRPLVMNDPSSVSARNVLGAAWLGQGNMNEARLELEKVLRMNPNLSDAHYNLAQVYLFSRPPDLAQARRHYRQALELGATPDREIEQLLKAP
ncbi:MAG TPA: hypothetical protein DCZ95_16595 [Verrucomicrobia bacterium]|nr:MAG: hypothetical protein A2X46_02255 [Lentisphaerae bacterium GWF2_57_35]HBA85702.1 hypothetical protein [Verrucomicrobiota bacterium]